MSLDSINRLIEALKQNAGKNDDAIKQALGCIKFKNIDSPKKVVVDRSQTARMEEKKTERLSPEQLPDKIKGCEEIIGVSQTSLSPFSFSNAKSAPKFKDFMLRTQTFVNQKEARLNVLSQAIREQEDKECLFQPTIVSSDFKHNVPTVERLSQAKSSHKAEFLAMEKACQEYKDLQMNCTFTPQIYSSRGVPRYLEPRVTSFEYTSKVEDSECTFKPKLISKNISRKIGLRPSKFNSKTVIENENQVQKVKKTPNLDEFLKRQSTFELRKQEKIKEITEATQNIGHPELSSVTQELASTLAPFDSRMKEMLHRQETTRKCNGLEDEEYPFRPQINDSNVQSRLKVVLQGKNKETSEQRELASCTFSPAIKTVRGVKSKMQFPKIQQYLINVKINQQQKENRAIQIQKQREEAELAACTSRPNISRRIPKKVIKKL